MNTLRPIEGDRLYSEDVTEKTLFIESLPHLNSFEHAMYDNLVHRMATHESGDNDVLYIPKTFIDSQQSESLNMLLHSADYVIHELSVSSYETRNPKDYIFHISFIANEDKYSIASNHQETVCEVTSNGDDSRRYLHPAGMGVELLATMIHAKHNSDQHGLNLAPENLVREQRDDLAARAENLIVTMGHYQGRSLITTTSIFDQGHGLLAANLAEVETPGSSEVDNKLDLSFIDTNSSTEFVINQSKNSLPTKDDSQNGKYSEIKNLWESIKTVYIDPRANYPEWSALCVKFYDTILEAMSPYLKLDE